LPQRELCIDNLLVIIHTVIVMIGWTGLAPREFEFLFPGSLALTLPHVSSWLVAVVFDLRIPVYVVIYDCECVSLEHHLLSRYTSQ